MKGLTTLITAALCLSPAFASAQIAPTAESVADSALPDYAWDICNETSFILRTAYGLSTDGKLVVTGWKEIIPGACLTTQYSNPQAPRFLYAESLPVHRGGIREWKGDVELCASDEDFTAEATDQCALSNLKTRNYLAVDPSESRTTLIEPADFGPKAETAALQRLLQDVGYKVSKVDGLTGRRTNKYLRDFKKSNDLDKNLSGADLIAALREVAELTVQTVGIEMCNDSSATIWGAIATQDNGSWQSKGWWEIETGQCHQLLTKSILTSEAHYYAMQQNIDPENPEAVKPDKRLRAVSATPTQFCISESRFSALGREFCNEGGYVAANFRPIVTDKDGVKITLTDSDFAETSAAGLRR